MNFIRRTRAHLVVCLILLGLCAPALAGVRYTLITILHTNDIHGRVMPRDTSGGLARAATLVKRIRSEMPNVLLIDAGDIIHGTPEDYFSGGLATITSMNAAGYCCATVGNHEFDFGLGTLENAASVSAFPLMAANIRTADGGRWNGVSDYVIFNVDGVRVAVIGITTIEVITLHWPKSVERIRVDNPVETARAMVPKLREQADVVVVLSHLGDKPDVALAKSVPGIDFIVGGHSHSVIADWRWVGNTLVSQAGAYARALGRIDFIVRTGDGSAEIVSTNGRNGLWNDQSRSPLGKTYPRAPLIEVDDSLPPDEAVVNAYMPFRENADARLSEVIGHAPDGVPGRAPTSNESPAANLLADAVRWCAKSDVAAIDAKALGERGIAPGPVTVKSVFDLIGGYTRQEIVVARLTGIDLSFAVEKMLSDKGAGYLAISGEHIDPATHYTVAAQAYVMMDLMKAAPGAIVIAELPATTREALTDYIRSNEFSSAGTLCVVPSFSPITPTF